MVYIMPCKCCKAILYNRKIEVKENVTMPPITRESYELEVSQVSFLSFFFRLSSRLVATSANT